MTWKIFYFLWGDPVFDPPVDGAASTAEGADERLKTLRRKLVLSELELLHMEIATLEAKLAHLDTEWGESQKFWANMHAQECWLLEKIKNQLPDGVYADALMDRQVNRMDPDFSFRKWYAETKWVLDEPPPEYLTS